MKLYIEVDLTTKDALDSLIEDLKTVVSEDNDDVNSVVFTTNREDMIGHLSPEDYVIVDNDAWYSCAKPAAAPEPV